MNTIVIYHVIFPINHSIGLVIILVICTCRDFLWGLCKLSAIGLTANSALATQTDARWHRWHRWRCVANMVWLVADLWHAGNILKAPLASDVW